MKQLTYEEIDILRKSIARQKSSLEKAKGEIKSIAEKLIGSLLPDSLPIEEREKMEKIARKQTRDQIDEMEMEIKTLIRLEYKLLDMQDEMDQEDVMNSVNEALHGKSEDDKS